MGKRKPRLPFEAAYGLIDRLEQAVCYRAVTGGYTIEDVCRYLWPPHVVDALRAAYPFINSNAHRDYWESGVKINAVECSLFVNVNAASMCTPGGGIIFPQDDERAPSPIMADLYTINETHRKFNRVRNVVGWLNHNATPMAARYYFPSLGAVLPPDHAFHTHDGLRSAGCSGNIAEIADDMRDASVTLATGLLCDPDKIVIEAHLFKVHIVTGSHGLSNQFALI